MALDMTTFDAALKTHYTDETVENLVYPNNPFLAMVPKFTDFGGKNFVVPVIYGNPQGRSVTFSSAVANKGNSSITDFVLTRVKDYSIASVDNETLEASKGNANALIEAATTEIDGALQSATRSLATALFRNGTGSIGRVNNSGFATTSLDLVTDADSINFEIGMVLTACATETGSSVKSGTLTVTAVNRTATSNQITTSANLSSGIATIAQNDFLYVQGDYDGKVKGLEAWLPSSAPGATSFFGVDRSVDPTRLGGLRYDGSSLSVEEALIEGANLCAREGGRPDYCFISFDKFADLVKELGSKAVRTEASTGRFSFSAIELYGPNGIIKVVPDQNCPVNRAFMLQLNTWKLYSLGPAPKILKTDGLTMLREASNDAVEIRTGYYAQLGTRAPGYNCNIQL